ncbi:hypothetical protein CP977_21010 [Streptomyces cinereoruber]|uniref:Uncharacterized protein n=1 Tax=Streptomyces cinereoruber TaxID=67260 RepID=A0ABX6BGZ9_9ACTN|nr:hypothetical protein DBP18_10520 [Streptomyces sp. CS081A]QEV34334.1 hypothetical protein CP977_21010 [Streptomyces cinereoruber]
MLFVDSTGAPVGLFVSPSEPGLAPAPGRGPYCRHAQAPDLRLYLWQPAHRLPWSCCLSN